jgi:ABC-type polysaccharide/polyol phosphate transport system ATPase subunit
LQSASKVSSRLNQRLELLDRSCARTVPANNTIAIRVEHATQRFRVIHERPDTLRELFSKFFRHTASYYSFEAVRDVSFEVPKGQTIAILGRNGSGKSTLLKIIAGVYQPTSGHVDVCGTIAPLIEIGAGFHPELTGRENILLNGLLMGYSKREMQEREAPIIQFADIEGFIDVPVKQYSSGMYMRLAFAVATEVDPDILLLDEILSVGDLPFQQKCVERIKRFHDAGKTILFVTHSLNYATSFCDRAILMDGGSVIAEGNPQSVVDAYQTSLGREYAIKSLP